MEAGPQLSYMISAKEKYTLLNGSEATATISKDFLNQFDFGIGIGAGYYFTEKLGANIRYVAGITDIYKYNDNDAVRNNNVQVGLMYIINWFVVGWDYRQNKYISCSSCCRTHKTLLHRHSGNKYSTVFFCYW